MAITSPGRRFHHVGLELVLLASLGCVLGHPGELAADEPPVLRVRSSDASITELIGLGAERSLTFRNLMAIIQGSDGMVYVESGACGHGTRACLKMWMCARGSTRFLRVMVNRVRGTSDLDLVSSIGHELQHSVEALSEPATVDSLGLYNFFSRTASARNDRFETVAAIHAGDAVRRELDAFRERRVQAPLVKSYLVQRAD
jgi:hypothetical protein